MPIVCAQYMHEDEVNKIESGSEQLLIFFALSVSISGDAGQIQSIPLHPAYGMSFACQLSYQLLM